MSLCLLIKNGWLISENYYGRYDVEIKGHKITKISKFIQPSKHHKVIDAYKFYTFPGIIDPHTHFQLQAYNSETLENFYTGTKT
ncbi:MAG: dihydropyrimidinase, partial [Endomicrobia bacterium]|nr:dihydropyrimidinase [Endomicrobiia bacterium]